MFVQSAREVGYGWGIGWNPLLQSNLLDVLLAPRLGHAGEVGLVQVCPKGRGPAATRGRSQQLRPDGRQFARHRKLVLVELLVGLCRSASSMLLLLPFAAHFYPDPRIWLAHA